MQKVNPPARLGQGTAPSCSCAPFQPQIPPEPAEHEVREAREAMQAEERALLESLAPPAAATTLIEERGYPEFRPHSHLAMRPRTDRTLEEAILRSLARRAMRTVRPHIQGIPQEELWAVIFDERCLLVGSDRLAIGVEGQPLAAPLSMFGWAEAKGARAIVLVQNQPGSRHAAPALDLAPTLKIAITAHLHGMILVDHIIIHATGSATHLRRWSALAEAQALTVQLQTDITDLASNHPGFGLPRSSEASPRPAAMPLP